jgi:hypothetical protein
MKLAVSVGDHSSDRRTAAPRNGSSALRLQSMPTNMSQTASFQNA